MANKRRMTVTHNSTTYLTAIAGAEAAQEIDLGLAAGQAARILAVFICTRFDASPGGVFSEVVSTVSWDKEDTGPSYTDDHFVCVRFVADYLGIAGGMGSIETFMYDFGHMNLLTTQNLAGCLSCVGTNGAAFIRVFWDKIDLDDTDLVALLSMRR